MSFDNNVNEMAYDQISQSARDGHHSKKSNGGKKRRVNNELQGVCELLGEMN